MITAPRTRLKLLQSSLIRRCITCVCSVMVLIPLTLAQRDVERTYHAFFTGLSAGAGEKYVIEAFTGQDPTIVLSLDLDLNQAKLRTSVVLDVQAIRADLEVHGIGLVLLSLMSPEEDAYRVLLQQGFPQYQDTGDPVADEADLRARKEAWIAAHPAAYEEMLQPRNAP